MNIQGTSDSQKSVNTFVDTLNFTKYKVSNKDSGKYAFNSVTENQFAINSTSNQKNNSTAVCQGAPAPASYQLTVKFDPTLFANSSDVALDVPVGLVTTRSILDDPSNLFNGDAATTNTQTNNTNNKTGGQ